MKTNWLEFLLKRIRLRTAPYIKKLLPKFFLNVLRKWTKKFPKYSFLHLVLSDMDNLPRIDLPDGFQVETLSQRNKTDYIQVINFSFKEKINEESFYLNFFKDPRYNPNNFFIILSKTKKPVAAGAAWQTKLKSQEIGQVVYLGVVKPYRRLGLGRSICLLCLHRLKKQGFKKALIQTEDYRLHAIRLYLSLGFKPFYINKWDKKRWNKVMLNIEKL